MQEATHFEELGGEVALRRIIAAFVDRITSDIMIGFHFRAVDHDRLKQREYEFAARHLGAEVGYSGRPLPLAHAPHRIQEGQFMRRLQILKEVLSAHAVSERVAAHWVAHTLSLKDQIVKAGSEACGP